MLFLLGDNRELYYETFCALVETRAVPRLLIAGGGNHTLSTDRCA